MLLPSSTGYFLATAGVNHPFASDQTGAFVRAELGWKPRDNLSLFAFAQADNAGLTAGTGLKVTF